MKLSKDDNYLFLTFEFPPHPGGIGTYSYQMAKQFHEMGQKTIVLTIQNEEPDEEAFAFDRAQAFHIIRFSRSRFKSIDVVKRFIKSYFVARQYRVKGIHVCSWTAGLIGLFLKITLRIPYVITTYGTELLLKNEMRTNQLKTVLSKTDNIIAISNFTAEMTKKLCTTRPIEIITLGADVDIYSKTYDIAYLQDKPAFHDKKIILSVGKLSQRKAQDIVIRAMKTVTIKHPDAVYLIVGKGVERENYQRLIQSLDLERNAIIVGYVSQEELPNYYQLCDIMVLTSRVAGNNDIEGYGIVFIEANMMGKPVIGSRTGGIADAVEDEKTALLCEPNDPDAVAACLIRLLDSPELCAKMGSYGRERALRECTWTAVAQRTFDLVTKVATEQYRNG